MCVCVFVIFLGGTASGVCETEKRGGIFQSFYLLQLSHWLGHIVSCSNMFFFFFYAFILQCVSHKVQTSM